MTLEEFSAAEQKSERMDKVGDALEEVLSKALSQRTITVGVYEAAKLLNVDPDNVVLCLLAADEDDDRDVALQIHFTLIQAFCCENDIDILRVSNPGRLAELLLLEPHAGPASEGAEQPPDLHCVLVTVRLGGAGWGVHGVGAGHPGDGEAGGGCTGSRGGARGKGRTVLVTVRLGGGARGQGVVHGGGGCTGEGPGRPGDDEAGQGCRGARGPGGGGGARGRGRAVLVTVRLGRVGCTGPEVLVTVRRGGGCARGWGVVYGVGAGHPGDGEAGRGARGRGVVHGGRAGPSW
ncbi:unnamed protein product [Nyctereutes procyonoides]|uniref:Growth arrest and DNA damage-inducible protein GADD45 alpha n=1 Tax=Nyctereutes procyonoides TaxID=34880 RepID=A0A811Z2P3_NYCPR|nr:unnamed protein product [Nyctereutes procyonoides]